jgi:sulfur transfer complex TusBCD TusB component (DsrH family)
MRQLREKKLIGKTYMSKNPYNARYGIPYGIHPFDALSGLPNKRKVANSVKWPKIGAPLVGEHMSEFILKAARTEAAILEKLQLSGQVAGEVLEILKTWEDTRNALGDVYDEVLVRVYGMPSLEELLSTADTRKNLAAQLGISDKDAVSRIDTVLKSKFSPRGVYSDAINATMFIDHLTSEECKNMSCHVYIDHEMDDLIALGIIAQAFRNVYVYIATDFVDIGKQRDDQRFDFAIRQMLNQETPRNVVIMGEFLCCSNVFGAMEHILEFFDGDRGKTPSLLDHLRPLAVARDCKVEECKSRVVSLVKANDKSLSEKAELLKEYLVGQFRFVNPSLTPEQIGQYVPGLFNASNLARTHGLDYKDVADLFTACTSSHYVQPARLPAPNIE